MYGVATEDMDTLTFGAPRMLRHLVAPGQTAQPVVELDRTEALRALDITDDQVGPRPATERGLRS